MDGVDLSQGTLFCIKKRKEGSQISCQPRAPGRQRLHRRKGWCFALLPSGSCLAPVFLIKRSYNLAPFTLLIQGPETTQSPQTESISCFQHQTTPLHHEVNKVGPNCRDSGRTESIMASCPDWKPGPRVLSACPVMLTTMTP